MTAEEHGAFWFAGRLLFHDWGGSHIGVTMSDNHETIVRIFASFVCLLCFNNKLRNIDYRNTRKNGIIEAREIG